MTNLRVIIGLHKTNLQVNITHSLDEFNSHPGNPELELTTQLDRFSSTPVTHTNE